MTSIVMLCQDRFRLTRQAITSLMRNTGAGSFNLTLMDDGSTDFRVSAMLRLQAENRSVSLLEVDGSDHNLGKLKNLGVMWSALDFGCGPEDWLYLSDCDVYFREGWLDKLISMAESTEEHKFRLWGGQVHPFHQSIADWSSVKSPNPFMEYAVLDGPSWLMRWKTWHEFGPLTMTGGAGPCQSEEYPFCEKLRAAGGRIGVIQPHVVIHTGLTQTDGKDAPGRKEREQHRMPGILYE